MVELGLGYEPLEAVTVRCQPMTMAGPGYSALAASRRHLALICEARVAARAI